MPKQLPTLVKAKNALTLADIIRAQDTALLALEFLNSELKSLYEAMRLIVTIGQQNGSKKNIQKRSTSLSKAKKKLSNTAGKK